MFYVSNFMLSEEITDRTGIFIIRAGWRHTVPVPQSIVDYPRKIPHIQAGALLSCRIQEENLVLKYPEIPNDKMPRAPVVGDRKVDGWTQLERRHPPFEPPRTEHVRRLVNFIFAFTLMAGL